MSMTGANADERFTHRPSEAGVVAAALLSAVNGQGAAGVTGKLKEGIEKAAKDLAANRGKGLVVSGSNNPTCTDHCKRHQRSDRCLWFYHQLGCPHPYRTRVWIVKWLPSLSRYGSWPRRRTADLRCEPRVTNISTERDSKNALKRVKLTVSFNDRQDETTKECKYILPAPHFLESWGDAEPKAGLFSMIQPTINPLFQTRPFQDSLLKWAGNATAAYDVYFKNYWTSRLGSAELVC